jgi:hypothetical protein
MADDKREVLTLVQSLTAQLRETLLQAEMLEHALTSTALAGVRPSAELLDGLAATAHLASALWQRFPAEEPVRDERCATPGGKQDD